MKFAILALFLTTFSCINRSPTDLGSGIQDLAQSRADTLISQWLDLWATYDLDQLSDIFLQSEDLTYFSSEKEGLITGYDQMLPHHEGFGFVHGGTTPPNELWLEEIDTRIYGSSAVTCAIWYFGDPTTVRDSVQNGPVTFVLSPNPDGELRIAHTHFGNYE